MGKSAKAGRENVAALERKIHDLLLLGITVALAVLASVGFAYAREQRHLGRRHFAAFIGFGAAIVASGATCIFLVTNFA